MDIQDDQPRRGGPPVHSKLRASAAPWVAGASTISTHVCTIGSKEAARRQSPAACGDQIDASPPTPSCSLMDLPHDVLSCILGCMRLPKDVLALGMCSKQSLAFIRQAPLFLDLSTTLAESGGGGHLQEGFAAGAARTLCKYMPGVFQLDLSNRPVLDQDLEGLLQGLTQLHVLSLSGCKKLIDPVPVLLRSCCEQLSQLAHCTVGHFCQPHLRPSFVALDLQRCFQLDGTTLTRLMHAAAAAPPCLRGLRCLAFSHLDLKHWPLGDFSQHQPGTAQVGSAAAAGAAAAAAAAPESPSLATPAAAPQRAASSTMLATTLASAPMVEVPAGASIEATSARLSGNSASVDSTLPGFAEAVVAAMRATSVLPQSNLPPCLASNLQVLALNCCTLSENCLITISLCCPKLQYLLLGGSSISPPPPVTGPQPAHSCQLDQPLAYQQAMRDVRAALEAHRGDPFIRSGMGSLPYQPTDSSLPRVAPESLTAARLRQQLRHVQHGAAVQEGSAGGAGARAEHALVAAAARVGCVAAAAARCMPLLRGLEVSMMPVVTVESVKVGLGLSSGDSAPPLPTPAPSNLQFSRAPHSGLQVWDLAEPEGVAGASQAHELSVASGHVSTQGDVAKGAAGQVHGGAAGMPPYESMQLGLQCAANCSNAARLSPLHLAAVRGDAHAMRQLLRLGAVPDARERSGSSALFLASYHGHTDCISVLLQAGADVQMSNVAGEQPLYIAALRGNVEAVYLLIEACKLKGSAWLDPGLYGDGWSPLMAAAVANRFHVALSLLLAAGHEGKQAMLYATNKYGQTALHVAARKSSPRLLRLLLSFAGPEFVGLRDNGGETALDVARNHRHKDAEFVLLRALHG